MRVSENSSFFLHPRSQTHPWTQVKHPRFKALLNVRLLELFLP